MQIIVFVQEGIVQLIQMEMV